MDDRRSGTGSVVVDAAEPRGGDHSDPTSAPRAPRGTHRGRLATPVVGILVVLVAAFGLSGCGSPITLSGHLTGPDATSPAVGVEVAVFDSSQAEVAHTYSDTNGAYSFDADALPAGTYRLRFSATDWWHDAASWATATPVPLTTGSATVIDESLAPATGGASGTVTGNDATGARRRGRGDQRRAAPHDRHRHE